MMREDMASSVPQKNSITLEQNYTQAFRRAVFLFHVSRRGFLPKPDEK